MLEFLRGGGGVSERKLRLFGIACCRRAASDFPVDEYHRLLADCERSAEGHALRDDREAAIQACITAFAGCRREREEAGLTTQPLLYLCDALDVLLLDGLVQVDGRLLASASEARRALVPSATSREAEFAHQARLLRCFFGNPFAPPDLVSCGDCGGTSRGAGLLFSGSCQQCGGLGGLHRGHEWTRWNEGTVRGIAEGIYEEGAFARMPILADALLDAGCDDEGMLAHCREQDAVHARGCWVLDLLLNKG
jgi:hypothetical protein